jgi:nitrate reductase (NAD(P)H)
MQLAASDELEKQSGPSRIQQYFPPTPPGSEDSESERSAAVPPVQQQDEFDFPLPPPTTAPTQILDADAKTPDSWLARDPRLIRLTGNHPFNVEPPLSALYDEGFLTSPELFYVRNHGPVRQVLDDEVLSWEFSVEGMVERPMKLTLRDLLEQYEQRTYPITLVCAGNRRT